MTPVSVFQSGCTISHPTCSEHLTLLWEACAVTMEAAFVGYTDTHTHPHPHTASHKNKTLHLKPNLVCVISNTVSSNIRKGIVQRHSWSTNCIKSHVPGRIPRSYLSPYLTQKKKGVPIFCHVQTWFHFAFTITSTRLMLTAGTHHSNWY